MGTKLEALDNLDDDDDHDLETMGLSDGEESMDPAVHGKLLASIQSLDGKKKKSNAIRGVPLAPNTLDLAVHANRDKSKVTPEDLNIKQTHTKHELNKPLSSGELEMAKRKIARTTMEEDTSKWDPVVREFRLAPQVHYAKREHGIKMYEALKPKQFTPRSALEQELYAALGKSQDIMHPDKELTEAEERALKAMSIKEAKARRAELMKHHELLNRMELKAKRMKRIKSKKYRKILRREKEAGDKKELENLQKTDPEAFMEKMETLEQDRREERLTLKHTRGKFSRLHKAYSKFDDKTRNAIQEMLQKSKELTQKREDSSSEEENEEEKDILIENVARSSLLSQKTLIQNQKEQLKSISKKAGGWLDGPTKFVYDSKAGESSSNTKPEDYSSLKDTEKGDNGKVHAASESLFAMEEGESPSKKGGKKRKAAEIETDNGADNEELTSEQNQVLDKLMLELEKDSEDEESKPAEEPKKKKKKKNKKKKAEEEAERKAEEASKKVKEVTLPVVEDDEEEKEDEDNLDAEGMEQDNDNDMKVSMEELFEDEDFLEEFAKEKMELEEKSRPKVADLKLPGWGGWAGPDYKDVQKRKQEKKKPANKPVKKDNQPYVWLNPNRDEHIRKLQPKKVPFPYTSVQQYEASLRQPVSRGLVPETSTKLLTKPEIVTKLGHIIKPMDKEEYFGQKSEVAADENDKNFGVSEVDGKNAKVGKNKNKRRSLK